IIPQILASQTEKILYIDCDTLIVNNLQPLFNQKTESIITVSHDIDYERHIKRISLENKSYFNSGVILINTKRWVDKQITEKTLELLNVNQYDFPDQDALNITLCEHAEYNDKINHQLEVNTDDMNTNNDIFIIHYLGEDKPWYSLFITELYKKYLYLSPWYMTKLKKAKNSSRIRVQSKRTTNKLKKVNLYTQYLFYKIIT